MRILKWACNPQTVKHMVHICVCLRSPISHILLLLSHFCNCINCRSCYTVHKAPMLVYEIKNDKDLSVVTELAHSSRIRQSYFSDEFLFQYVVLEQRVPSHLHLYTYKLIMAYVLYICIMILNASHLHTCVHVYASPTIPRWEYWSWRYVSLITWLWKTFRVPRIVATGWRLPLYR